MKNELPIMPIRAMYAEKSSEGKNLDEAGEIDPSTLYGKFARIINAPESNTLTDEQIEIFKAGVFINGDYNSMHNPVVFPAQKYGGTNIWMGVIIGGDASPNAYGRYAIRAYQINEDTKAFSVTALSLRVMTDTNGAVELPRVRELKTESNATIQLFGKNVAKFPTDQTDKKFHFVLDNGTLAWQELTVGTKLYRHHIELSDYLEIKTKAIADDGTVSVSTDKPTYADKVVDVITTQSIPYTSGQLFAALSNALFSQINNGTNSYFNVDAGGNGMFGGNIVQFTDINTATISSDTVTEL